MEALRRHLRSWTVRPVRFFAVVAAVALVAAGAERALVAWRSHPMAPASEARWIWAEGLLDGTEPVAFYALRDFELPAPATVELAIAADETYCVFLDGRRLGANSYRPGAEVDRYLVPDLAAGRHRLAVELRSRRGAGGLLAALRAGRGAPAADPVLVSDGSWRIHRGLHAGLFDPQVELPPGEPPQIWQRAPTGRWRMRPSNGVRPLESPPGERPEREFPTRVRRAVDRSHWRELQRWHRQFPDLGPRILLDWGREVVGFLELDAAPPAPPALAYFGAAPPDPEVQEPGEVVIFVPGSGQWRSAHARRFRYVLLVGVRPQTYVRLLPVEHAPAETFAPPPPNGGVYGIRPDPPKNGIVDEIWRRSRL